MLKRISTSEIQLGMFIHKLEGSWFSHPFWKSRFLLDDPDMLATLQASAVNGVVIDTARGLDSARSENATDTPVLQKPAGKTGAVRNTAGLVQVPQSLNFSRPPVSMAMAREFGRARRVAGASVRVVSRVFIEARLGKAIHVHDVEPVLESIYASVQRNLYAFNGLLRCQSGNEPLYRHSLAVSALMIAMAKHMRYHPGDVRDAGMAGLLMDVGVGQLSVDLASVGGDYTLLRQDLREQHVVLGYSYLKAAGDIPEPVLRVVLHHHERLDGSGYPQGLTAPSIETLSRMAAICDTYDSLVSCGAPEARLDPADAIRHLREQPEKFDAALVAIFTETVGVFPIGSFVRLRSGRLAMVVDEDPTDRALPTVRAFWSLPQGQRVKGETIALAHCYGADAIEGVADLAGLDLPPTEKLRESLLEAACKEAG